MGTHVSYFSDLLPGLTLFALGLSMTVAPLTAAVLADATETDAGIASGVNNAIARVAGLMGTAAVGAAVAASFVANLDSQLQGARLGPAARVAVAEAKRLPLGLPDVVRVPPLQAHAVTSAAEQASLHGFHVGMAIAAVLLVAGGLIGALGVRNPRGVVAARECPAGQLVGTGRELVRPAGDAQPA